MNLYIGNLALETTEDELRRKFAGFGDAQSVKIMNDIYIGSGQPRGYAYVERTSKTDGTTAIAKLEGKKIGNRSINVVEALALSERVKTTHTYISRDHRTRKTKERV